MNLKLYKPLCIFDLETTGTHISKDRIIEISILKIFPNSCRESKTWRVNPEIHIPASTSEIHGIYDEDIKNAPTFKQIASDVLEMIKDADLGGFNSTRFDIPLLAEELLRAGLDFDVKKHQFIDVQTIFHKKEPRNLSAAYQFYCNKNLEGAHSAEADTLATFEILNAQITHYKDLPNEINKLSSEYNYHNKSADLAGFIGFNDEGKEIFTFGKYKGQAVKDIFQKDSGYYGWIQNSDFPLYTKKVFTRIQLKIKF